MLNGLQYHLKTAQDNDTLLVTYSDNTTTKQREGTITITGGGITKTVLVIQAAVPFELNVAPSEQNVESTAGRIAFNITSNTSWTVSDDAEWLSESPKMGSNNDTLVAIYSDNTAANDKSRNNHNKRWVILERIIEIHQDAKKFLKVYPSDTLLPANSGNFNLVIESNTNWELKKDIDWLHLNKYTGC